MFNMRLGIDQPGVCRLAAPVCRERGRVAGQPQQVDEFEGPGKARVPRLALLAQPRSMPTADFMKNFLRTSVALGRRILIFRACKME